MTNPHTDTMYAHEAARVAVIRLRTELRRLPGDEINEAAAVSLRRELQAIEDNLQTIEEWLVTARQTNLATEAHQANGRICDQVYQGPDGFWRIAYKGHILPDDWTTREAAEAHLSTLRRTA